MNFAVCIAVAFLLLTAGNIYINYTTQKDVGAQGAIAKKKNLLLPGSPKKAIYFIVSFFAIIFLAVVFNFHLLDVNGSNVDDIYILQQIKLICLISTIVPIALVDYQKHIIPNKILVVSFCVRAILYVFEFIFQRELIWDIFKMSFFGALAIGGFFILCAFIFKNSVGMGDVKLLILIALYLGISGAFASIFMSLIVCFLLSVFLLATRKKSRKDELAFAPCILIGTYISLVLIGG